MSTTFQILDAVAQDIYLKETEDTAEITFVENDYDSDDGEVRTRRKGVSAAAVTAEPAALEGRKMTIHLFGATATGQPIRANITGFEPFFFVRLPDGRADTRGAFERRVTALLAKSKRPAAVDITYTKRKVLFGYTGGAEFPFARLAVSSLEAFRAVKNIFLNKDSEPIFRLAGTAGEPLEVFEANLDPMLRFFHLRNLQPCGWVTVDAEGEEAEDGTLELYAGWEDIRHCDKPPAATARFLTASWDIETYSENGEFTIPKRGYDRAAKLLVAGATSGEEGVSMLSQALLYPDSPPKGMDPLRLRSGSLPDRKRLDAILKDQAFLQELDASLRDTAAAATRTKRVLDLLNRRLAKAFPLAGDPVIQVGVVLQRGSDAAERHIFVVGTCDPVDGATVHAYKDEAAMLRGWAAQMRAWNPDILLGYNVFGFDERYIWERALELGLVSEEKSETGWSKTECEEDFHALTRLWDRQKEFSLQTKFLSSSALGDNTMYMWTTHGRLQVDLYHYVKRGYALGSYKLDDVCQHFMSGKLATVDTSGSATWILKTKSTADVIPGRSVVLLDETGDGVVDKLRVVEVRKGEAVVVEAPQGDDAADLALAAATAVKWAVVKDDVSPQDIFRFHRGSAADRALVAAYCIQDCVLVLDLYKKLDVFNNSMAMANACSVPVGYIFTRGQGIKIESLIFKECYERAQCVKVLPQPAFGSDAPIGGGQEESYEGAIVLDPTPGFYFDSPIGVADFASLYPSTIISENISYDTLVWVKDFNLDGSFRCYALGDEAAERFADPSVRWTEITFDIWGSDPADKRKHPAKIKTGLRVCRYAQYVGEAKGTLPQIVAKLLATRKAKRKEGEKETDPFRKALLDAEQLAYKLTANSLYGQLGSATFKIRLQHLAASVTAYGRKQIMFAKAAIEKFYGPEANDPRCSANAAQVVYGDSVGADTILESVRLHGKNLPQLSVETLSNLFNNAWIPCVEPGKQEKEACETPGLETLTEMGWTPVHRIIRHHLGGEKKMMRVSYTLPGDDSIHTIDVTEDHSMILANGETISPKDLPIGASLLRTSGEGAKVFAKTTLSNYVGYVYDLTTENHHFQAGPGALVVHNTDSLFVNFNVKDPATGQPLTGRAALEATMALTEEAGKFVSKALAAPHDFEYDKVFSPFIIFSKKRYVGNKYEESPEHYSQTSMGIATKRRDYAPLVKVIYGGALRILLTDRDINGAIRFVQEKMTELVEGKMSLNLLTMSKSLRAEYNTPTPPAHKVLAERIAARDPGNAPASGDRIPFIYVLPPPGQLAAKLQGERVETPSYIRAKGLKPDYRFYVEHQLLNPVTQLFALVAEQIPGVVPPKNGWAAATPGERESATTEAIFRPVFNLCDRLATQRFGASMFGLAPAAVPAAVPKKATSGAAAAPSASTTATPKPKVQMTVNSYFVDKLLAKGFGRQTKTSKKAADEAAGKRLEL